jgi:uncharacterized BrkB/YihY/UPF0761 family membrane protein
MKPRESLENILKRHDKANHVRHIDPAEGISHFVVAIIFFAVLFLFGVLMFFTAQPDEQSATTFAIVEYEPITIHEPVVSAVTGFLQNVRMSEDRGAIMLMLFTVTIIAFVLINMVRYERKRN